MDLALDPRPAPCAKPFTACDVPRAWVTPKGTAALGFVQPGVGSVPASTAHGTVKRVMCGTINTSPLVGPTKIAVGTKVSRQVPSLSHGEKRGILRGPTLSRFGSLLVLVTLATSAQVAACSAVAASLASARLKESIGMYVVMP